MKKNLNLIILILLLVLIVLVGPIKKLVLAGLNSISDGQFSIVTNLNSTATGIVENRSIYSSDSPNIIDFYITVLDKSEDKSEDKYMTFSEMNNISDSVNSNADPNLQVIIQEGNEFGPVKGKYGYGTTSANGVIELRGQSSRNEHFKSYKVKLFDNAGLWNGQKVLNFNKHVWDMTRVRNKLSFDLFTQIPNMTSLRTQFVRLHIKDLSSTNSTNEFVDYGLYTEIEQPNRTFLSSHGLDPNGQLYKVNYFEFQRTPDIIKNVDDPSFNKKKFEELLEMKAGNDNSKLIQMLDDLNDYSKNIDDVVDKYFDRDNYLTWLATNILFGNFDTDARNYFLYSPSNSLKWYFLPWDYDGAWARDEQKCYIDENQRASWMYGVSNYWGVVLHRRFLKDSDNLEQLNRKIEEISKLINAQTLKKSLDSYYEIIKPQLAKEPDISSLPMPFKDYDEEFGRFYEVIENNKKAYYENIQKPMPVYMDKLLENGKDLKLSWSVSFDFQGDQIFYDVIVAKDPELKNIVFTKSGLETTEVVLPAMAKGEYYWKVTIRDNSGNKQIPFDTYFDNFGKHYFGISKFVIDK